MREHHALHRPQRPARSGDQRRQCRQEPARHRDHRGRRLRLCRELRLAQHLEGRSRSRTRSSRSSARPRCRRRARWQEQVLVGAEMFFSTRGHFDRPAAATDLHRRAPVAGRLAELRQLPLQGPDRRRGLGVRPGSAQVHPDGRHLQPQQPQRAADPQLLGAARRDARTSTLNVRNVSGPGPLAVAHARAACRRPMSAPFDPNHGLLVGDLDFNKPPCVINDFLKPNTGRSQVTVTLPGSSKAVPALDALNEWIKFAIRVPNGPLTDEEIKGGVSQRRSTRAASCSRSSSARTATAAGCGPSPSRTSRRHPPPRTSSAKRSTPGPLSALRNCGSCCR